MNQLLKKIYWNVFSTHQWNILYKLINSDDWIRLKQPKNVSRADPFIINENNRSYIFFEEFNISKRHGYLCVGELNQESKSLENVEVCLEKSYHLSFPNVFKHDDAYYMIHESHENKTVDLYRFDEFPYKLVKVRTLIEDVEAVDSVVLFKDNVCYLFTTMLSKDSINHSGNLSLFISNDILNKPFIEKHSNPVESSLKNSRMAGQFYKENNKLYRVAQDCKLRYGYKVNIYQVDKLTQNQYSESLIKEMPPPKGYIAFHTFNGYGDILMADGKIILKSPKVLMNNIINLISLKIKKIIT